MTKWQLRRDENEARPEISDENKGSYVHYNESLRSSE